MCKPEKSSLEKNRDPWTRLWVQPELMRLRRMQRKVLWTTPLGRGLSACLNRSRPTIFRKIMGGSPIVCIGNTSDLLPSVMVTTILPVFRDPSCSGCLLDKRTEDSPLRGNSHSLLFYSVGPSKYSALTILGADATYTVVRSKCFPEIKPYRR
ncbi:hypothetical protein EG68_11497 [Paragonimus skrjabini miyazakii]|uniref:Uncharacterized protein n=1 Tax=Paragonimus skrjabini miyazakii TaxID=59628 RepID=A0A8S9YEC9_9TREM|nr:hypothetical protein EG68_11497 [Paragonimus skrjabini miyazakii]